MVDIAIIRTNSVLADPRLVKIVRSLSSRYSVLVLGWNREGSKFHGVNQLRTTSETSVENHDAIFNILKIKAPFGKSSLISYLPLIVYLPIFWVWVFIKLIIYRPQVVHACDLDTALPAYIYKLLFQKPMVFEVFDRYAMTFISPKFKMLYSAINLIEELFSEKSDYLITVGEKLLKTFRRRPKHYAIIMNCPEDYSSYKSKSEDKDDTLTIVYTGGIKSGRALENITAAIKDLIDVELDIAGPIIDKELLDRILEIPNVKYRGVLQPHDSIILEASADIIIGLYDLEIPENKFAMPNKLFEAMMIGIPIITNVASEVIEEIDCGIVLKDIDILQIKTAVILLRNDRALCRRLGNNGRLAFLNIYNWAKMEKMLYEIYDNLLHKK